MKDVEDEYSFVKASVGVVEEDDTEGELAEEEGEGEG